MVRTERARRVSAMARRASRVMLGLLAKAAAAGVFVIVGAVSTDAAPAVRQILLLQSIDRGSVVFDGDIEGFRGTLETRAFEPVTVWQFVLAPAGFVDAPEEPTLDFLRKAFRTRGAPDLIVTIGGPAAAFARKFHAQLFPQTPIVFGATDPRFLGEGPLAHNETAVTTMIDQSRLIDDILQLLPQTTNVFVVTGAGPLGQFWRKELERNVQGFRDRLAFTWTDDLTYAEMLERAKRLPPRSAILFVTSGTDAQGGWRSSDGTIADLAAHGSAPVFGIQSAWLGLGIVGGTLMSSQNLGALIADVALRTLHGESAGDIHTPPREVGPSATFDARQLQKWNIPEARLPAGSVVRFEAPSLWRDYRREALGALGVVTVQSMLIIGLLYQRQARRRAEADSRRHLALAADAHRRSTVSVLAGSIAHELSQPLGAIAFNASTADRLVAANRATADELREILSDISASNARATQILDRHRAMLKAHRIDLQPIDLNAVVRESMPVLAHESHARQVDVRVDVPETPSMVRADAVLLQQVVVNLVMNAMDAMAAMPASERRLTVRTHRAADGMMLSIQDGGPGVPASLDGHLFEPYVTTKPNGLGIGLTIVRTIVEAHNGRLEARNNAEGGATFVVTLPPM